MMKNLKKRLPVAIVLLTLIVSIFASAIPTKAKMEYMTSEDARVFLAFIYNSSTERVTVDTLKNDGFYKLLTGAYANDSKTEKATAAAFLMFVDARIEYMLAKTGHAVQSASSYLVDYLNDKLEDEVTGLIGSVFKNNILSSVINLCGDDGGEVVSIVEGIGDIKDSPEKFISNVKAITSAFTYAYGQNIESLYTYFDSAISCVDLKKYEGAYETAMSANILMLKDSNIFGSISALIPGLTSWEDWIDEMDVWAQYVYDLRKYATSTDTEIEWYMVTFKSNCDEVEDVSYAYIVGYSKLVEPEMKRNGYVFAGWYWDEECTRPATGTITIDRDIVVYAKWVDRYYNIEFNSCCDTVENYTYVYDILADNWVVPEMKRDGYLFAGWYWDENYTSLVEEVVIDSDKVMYARWVSIYNLTQADNKLTINGVKSGAEKYIGEDLKIPSHIDGLPVTSIAKGAFRNNSTIKTVEIPDGVTTISEGAFQSCRSLEAVYIGNSVTVIGKDAFLQNSNLGKVVLGNSVSEIGNSAFAYCFQLSEINIPSSVRVIGDSAFFQCKALSKITLSDNLEKIGNSVFFQCGIEEIVIPDKVKEIEMNAFCGCSSLKKVTIGSSVETIGNAFAECTSLEVFDVKSGNTSFMSKDGVLFDKNMTTLQQYPCGKKDSEYIVPDSVTEIAASAFAYNTFVKTIILPAGVTEIKEQTFYGDTALENVVLGENVTTIGSTAFGRCVAMKKIVLPQSVSYIETCAFEGCTALERINIPGSVGVLNYGVFGGCSSLKSAVLGEGIERIGYFAFQYCPELESISLPKSLKIIEAGAFMLSDAVNDVYYQSTAEDWSGVTIESENDSIVNADIHTVTVKATVGEVTQAEGKIKGSVEYEYLENDTDVMVGLYKDGELVDIFKSVSLSGSDSLDFELDGEEGEYTIKIFFWGVEALDPLSEFIEKVTK